MSKNPYSKLTPYIENLSKKCLDCYQIAPENYVKYDVKRGLRDVDGKGVLAGLTNISEIKSFDLRFRKCLFSYNFYTFWNIYRR